MDWPPDSDPFIAPNNFVLFDYDFDVRNEVEECKVIQNWGSQTVGEVIIRFLPLTLLILGVGSGGRDS